MNKKLIIIALILLAGISGCVTHTTLPLGAINPSSGNIIVAGEPTLGETVTRNIGDTIISSYPALQRPAVTLQQSFDHSSENLGNEFTIYFPEGTYYLEGEDHRGKFYRYSFPLRFTSNGSTFSVQGGLVVPHDQNSPHQIYWVPTDQPRNRISDPTSSFATRDAVYEEKVQDELKQVLIYNGISGGQIKFIYKEFINDLARPAFDQEVSYDFTPDETIGFKNARFRVIEANSTTITYIVDQRL
jgi:hypothetical protein